MGLPPKGGEKKKKKKKVSSRGQMSFIDLPRSVVEKNWTLRRQEYCVLLAL